MITFIVPEGGPSHIISMGGVNASTTTYITRRHGDRNVIDMPPTVFLQQLKGKNGLLWERLNQKAMRFIAENPGGYCGNPFPDE